MAKWLSNRPQKLKPPLTQTVFHFPSGFEFILGSYCIIWTYLSLKIARFPINSSPWKLSVEENLSFWNIYSNKTMQNLPPHVLTTIFRFVEEILSAKLIKVTYFPGSLLMLVITRWEFKSNTLTSWVEQTNKSTNFQQKKLKKSCITGHNFSKASRFLCLFSFNVTTFNQHSKTH